MLPPFFFVIILTLVLASFGKSLGIRNLYVKVLLFIFEVKQNFTFFKVPIWTWGQNNTNGLSLGLTISSLNLVLSFNPNSNKQAKRYLFIANDSVVSVMKRILMFMEATWR